MMNRLIVDFTDFVHVRFWDTPCTFWSNVKIKNHLTSTFMPKHMNFSITPRFEMFFLFLVTFWTKYFLHKIINFTQFKKMMG